MSCDKQPRSVSPVVFLLMMMLSANLHAAEPETLFPEDIDIHVPLIAEDPALNIDYDIVYVRAQRAGDEEHRRFYTDFSQPVTFEPGADLMLLHPDGSEELLIEGGDGSITDPVMSFDGEWVYYVHVYNLVNRSQWNPPRAGADIFKLHLPTRRIVRLTNQQFTPNTGAADWSSDYRSHEESRTHYDYGVFNMGPCPLPGGRLAFTSNRDGFRPARGYPAIALQLFVMDDRDESIGEDETPRNLDKIGNLNISGALHPVVLTDGRIMYSTLESQGIRSEILWGLWTIHPDGTHWAPLVSAFDPGGAPNGFHFQTQLSSGEVVFEEYYNQNNSGFGAFLRMPPSPGDYPAFGPAWMNDPRNGPWRYGRFYNAKPRWYRMPFMPTGSVSLTPFSHGREGPADPSVYDDPESPKVGKFTHPSGAPDNHLLTIYSPGPVNHQYRFLPQLDGGIYLLPEGRVIESPSELRLIKNDPDYNESWPRAVVPYSRIYGIDEPALLPRLANDGRQSEWLPAGTPYGLVGTSSFYKRESYPNGVVPEDSVTAEYAGGNDPWRGLDAFTSHGNGMPLNWHNQGGDAGLYTNDEIHAVRILVMEPTTDRQRGADTGRRFHSHANERLRILGEIPLRKSGASSEYGQTADGQPLDPDGNPDTSFLARVPADTAFTFQTLDADGLLLNMAQTWHQLRPGEIRTDCGGCHAHSQPPTLFEQTFAARDDYQAWDLINSTPLIAATNPPSPLPQGDGARGATSIGGEGPGVRGPEAASHDATRWDTDERTQTRFAVSEVLDVEYHRDIRPILERSCIACHTSSDEHTPAADLDLDADNTLVEVPQSPSLPGTYYRLAADERAQFGPKPFGYPSWGYPNASRYIRMFQARRSLLVWKLYGRRLDGFTNDDHPSESKPGSGQLVQAGEPVDGERNRARWDLDFVGQRMPPPAAVRDGKVAPLTDEDRRTILRWIDLGCPIDLEYDPEHADRRGRGWMLDDNRPILTIAEPTVDRDEVDRILIGMHDYGTGLDLDTFSVTADTPLDGIPAGTNLADHFESVNDGVWEWRLKESVATPLVLTVSVRDRQGNTTSIERTISRDPPT